MRYHNLRFDIWLCLLLSFGLSFIPVKIAEAVLPKKYDEYVEEHTVAEGDIGGKADETVYRAQNVEDLLTHDTFTIVSPGIQYRAGYRDRVSWRLLLSNINASVWRKNSSYY